MHIRMWRLILKLALSFLIYNISVTIVSEVLNATARLMLRGGSPELWTLLHQHPFGRAIVVGLLAGLIPLDFLFSVSGLFRSDLPEFFRRLDLEKMKKWIVVLASPVAAAALIQWLGAWLSMHSRQITVVAESSSTHLSQMFEGFFSPDCKNPSDFRLDMWGNNFAYECMVHVLQISIFLTAAAYSLAPWARLKFLKYVAIDHPVPPDSGVVENEMQESTTGNELNV